MVGTDSVRVLRGTEGNGFVCCNSEEWLAHRGTVGRSLVGEVHILDEEGEVPAGEPGTIYFGGGAEFTYHNDPDKTAAAHDPGGHGWTTLGDVGYLDDDGFLYLTDRKAYMIITGGVNVYPQEAENVPAMHPRWPTWRCSGSPTTSSRRSRRWWSRCRWTTPAPS